MPKSKSKKRILIVCQHFWPENFRINDIADFLANEKDCEVDVLCGIPNYPSGTFTDGYSLFKNRKQTYNSIKIHRVIEIPRGSNSNIRIFLNYVSFPFFSLFHIPKLLTKNYDHIFLYQLSPVMMSVSGLVVGKLKKTPTTMYVLDLWPENLYSVLDIKNPFLRRVASGVSNWHYKKADRLIALSDTMKSRLSVVSGKQSNKILTLPQTCEKIYEQHVNDPDLTNRFKDTFNIVYAGNISPAQSMETLVESAEIVVASGITNIRWIIVGDGMSKKSVEALVQQKSLSDYIVFEGRKPIEVIPTYSYIADVFIGCLVKSELLEATIPAKVVSYLASSKPILLAMDGEVQELINQTVKCGYASETEDIKALAQNTIKLYNLSADERKELGKRGKTYYDTNLERNTNLNQLYSFIFTS